MIKSKELLIIQVILIVKRILEAGWNEARPFQQRKEVKKGLFVFLKICFVMSHPFSMYIVRRYEK